MDCLEPRRAPAVPDFELQEGTSPAARLTGQEHILAVSRLVSLNRPLMFLSWYSVISLTQIYMYMYTEPFPFGKWVDWNLGQRI